MAWTFTTDAELIKVLREQVELARTDVRRLNRELAALGRDAAISLLLEAPAECSTFAPLPKRCGTCWTCRVDKFLRDAGVR